MAALMLVISISPFLAPLAGASLLQFWGWRAIFAILTIVSLASLLFQALFLTETLAPEARARLSGRVLLAGLKTLMTDRSFMALTFMNGFAMASFFVFISSVSFIHA